MIDTGDDRSITGHFISGAVFSAMFAGAMSYNKYKKKELPKNAMILETSKLAMQGGVGTASAVATANYIGNGNYVGALTALSMGAMGIYGVQKIAEMYERPSGGHPKGQPATQKASEASTHKTRTAKTAVKKPSTKRASTKEVTSIKESTNKTSTKVEK